MAVEAWIGLGGGMAKRSRSLQPNAVACVWMRAISISQSPLRGDGAFPPLSFVPGKARMKAWPKSRPKPAPTSQRHMKSPEGKGRLVSSTGVGGCNGRGNVCEAPAAETSRPTNTGDNPPAQHTHNEHKRTRGDEPHHHHRRQQAPLRVPGRIPGQGLAPTGGQPRRGAEVQRLFGCVLVLFGLVWVGGGIEGWGAPLSPQVDPHPTQTPQRHAPPAR